MERNDSNEAPGTKKLLPRWAVVATVAAVASGIWTVASFNALWRFLWGLPLHDFIALDGALLDGSIPFATYSLTAVVWIAAISYALSFHGSPSKWTSFAVCLSAGVWASSFVAAMSLAFSDFDSGDSYYSLSQARKWECSEDFSECSSFLDVRTPAGIETVRVWPVKTAGLSAGESVRAFREKRSESRE